MPNDPIQIQIIFFDVGGVLLKRTVHPEEQISAYLEVDHSNYMGKYEALITEPEFVEGWRSIHTLDREIVYMQRFYSRLLEDLGRENDPQTIEYMVDTRVKRTYEPIDGVYETLDYLSQKHRLGIISNALVSRKHYELKEFDLQKYFDPVIISHEVRVHKPDKGIFGIALQKAGLGANGAAFIDNKPENLRVARELGLGKVILFNPGKEEQGEFDEINHLTELKKIF